ncbi:MAG: hypothetical protein AAFU67_13200 [Bacteroidota bacterium]
MDFTTDLPQYDGFYAAGDRVLILYPDAEEPTLGYIQQVHGPRFGRMYSVSSANQDMLVTSAQLRPLNRKWLDHVYWHLAKISLEQRLSDPPLETDPTFEVVSIYQNY